MADSMRTIRVRGRLLDGTIAGDTVTQEQTQRPWHLDLIDVATGERVLKCLHMTIDISCEGWTQGFLTFPDGYEHVNVLIG